MDRKIEIPIRDKTYYGGGDHRAELLKKRRGKRLLDLTLMEKAEGKHLNQFLRKAKKLGTQAAINQYFHD